MKQGMNSGSPDPELALKGCAVLSKLKSYVLAGVILWDPLTPQHNGGPDGKGGSQGGSWG